MASFPPDDLKYIQKYNDLKRKVRQIELDNDRLHLKVLKTKKNIQRLHLERAILYERLSVMPPPASATTGYPDQRPYDASFSPQAPPPPHPPPSVHHREYSLSRPTSPPSNTTHAHPHSTHPHPHAYPHRQVDQDPDPHQRYRDHQQQVSQLDVPSSSNIHTNDEYRSLPSSSRFPPSSRSYYSSYSRDHERGHERTRDRERQREDADRERHRELRDRELGGLDLPPMRTYPHSHPRPSPHMETSPSLHHQPPPHPSPPHGSSNGYNSARPYSPDERHWEYDRDRNREKQREREREYDYLDRGRGEQHNNGYSFPHSPSQPQPQPPSYPRYEQHPQRYDQRYEPHPTHSQSPPTEYADPRSYHSHSRQPSATSYLRDYHPAPPAPSQHHPHTAHPMRRLDGDYNYEYVQDHAQQQQSRAKERDREPLANVPRVREGEVLE